MSWAGPLVAALFLPAIFPIQAANAQTIAGTVNGDGVPLDGVTVCFVNTAHELHHCVNTLADGSYVSNALATGDYVVLTNEVSGFVDEYYKNVQILGAEDAFLSATAVSIGPDSATGIDFNLVPGFTISGTVTDSTTTQPVGGDFCISDTSHKIVTCGPIESDGSYQSWDIPAGDYWIEAIPKPGYISEYYDDLQILGFDPITPTRVSVGPSDAMGIDFGLDPGASISGTVTDIGTGLPVAGITICQREAGSFLGITCADSIIDGAYSLSESPPGDYILEAFGDGYVGQYSGGVLDIGEDPISQATVISLGANNVAGTDFALTAGATISGFIRDGDLDEPAADGFACVYEAFAVVVACDTVDEQGLYITPTIPPGSYAVIGATETEVTIAEYFDDVPDFGPDFFDQASKIDLDTVPVNNVNFILAENRIGNIQTAAGGGDGGLAIAASLWTPRGAAVDAGGNLYIADLGNQRIRRVDASTGAISTVAGNSLQGFGGDGSLATTTSLRNPSDVTVDTAGNLYIADRGNHRIRRVDASTGVISTVAGNGTQGFSGAGGPATMASLRDPVSVVVDAAGNLYIADRRNHRIRRVDASTGTISTVAGNGTQGFSGDGGPATAASLNGPFGVTIDPTGTLYIADSENRRLRRVDASTGVISTVAGNGSFGFGGDGGPATAATLSHPIGVEVDAAGNLYVSDISNQRIRRIDASSGVISTVAGNGSQGFAGDGGPATLASLKRPSGVTIDAAGNLYIADSDNHRLRRVDASTGVISTVAGNGSIRFGGDGGPAIEASLNNPRDVAADAAGNLFIADQTNQRIRRVDASTGVIGTIAGNGSNGFGGDGGPATAASLSSPTGVSIDTAGNLYIADVGNRRIRRVDASTGIISTVAGNGSIGFGGDGGPAIAATLSVPIGVTVDATDNLYIADPGNSGIRRVDASTGVISTVAGNGTEGFSGDGGLATAASLSGPNVVATDSAGNLYISDRGNQRIRRVDASSGIIDTVAGNGMFGFGGDGEPATATSLANPSGIAIDAVGNLYISDQGNQRVRRVDASTGIISTVAGKGVRGFGGDGGPATTASLGNPFGVTINAPGNLYVSDLNNHRIRRVEGIAVGTIDTDDDGLTDSEEENLGTDPDVPDTDGDGLSDGDEVNAWMTDPLNEDTDFDGIADGDEVTAGTDPLGSDSDGDGLSDGDEVNLLGSNPLDADTDGDGIDDATEVGDPSNPTDTDGDGTPDYLDTVDDRTTFLNPATDHLYELIRVPDWTVSDARARLRGGSLVTINDGAELAWLLDRFEFMDAMIGLHDRLVEGSFQWASGESLASTDFTNWATGEPANTTADTDFVVMNSAGEWRVEEVAAEFALIEYPPPQIRLNPAATYLLLDTEDSAPGAAPLRLADFGIAPGDHIRLSVSGDWQEGINTLEDSPFSDVNTTLVGVFGATNVLLSGDQLQRVSGAIDAGNDYETSDTCLSVPMKTDIAEDFRIHPNTAIVVPDGAEYLFVSVDDCFFQDNHDPDMDFGLNLLVGDTGINLADRVYNFDATLADERGGPSMIPVTGESYEDGAFLFTGEDGGLRLDNGVLAEGYSIRMRYSLDSIIEPGSCTFFPAAELCLYKVVDFADRSSTAGVDQLVGLNDYRVSIFLFPGAGARIGPGPVDMVLTRDAETAETSLSVNGAAVVQLLDLDGNFAFSSPTATAHFVVDDLVSAGDEPSGRIEQVQVFDRTLPDTEALALSLTLDRDGDAVPDGDDVCPQAFDPLQTDTDGDGFGDACVPPGMFPPGIDVGENPTIGTGVEVNRGISIGDNVTVGANSVLNRDVSIGNDVTIGTDTVINRDVVLEDGVVIGNETILDRNVYVCANVVIGDNATVGKNQLVRTDIPDGATLGGVNAGPDPSMCGSP